MIINAKVKTNQPKFSIEKGEVWIISCTAAAESNKANIEIIKELSRHYKKVKIVKGLKSKKKVIELVG